MEDVFRPRYDPSLIHGDELSTLSKFGGRKVKSQWNVEEANIEGMCICVYFTFKRTEVNENELIVRLQN